jgi:mono/diheme cytochrome c family protein
MKHSTAIASVVATALFVSVGMVEAQQKAKVDVGKQQYEQRCAVCHAANGKGNGPYAPYLKSPAPDLTGLAKANGGVFPLQRVYEAIEGAGPGHGTRDMPIWGREFSIEAAEYYGDALYDAQAVVRARVLAVAEYLNRLQAK